MLQNPIWAEDMERRLTVRNGNYLVSIDQFSTKQAAQV